MTNGFGIQLRKEIRALLPWWLCAATATTAAAMLARRATELPYYRPEYDLWLAIVHGLGVVSVAALSIGQELTHGTLPALLVQPASRLRLLSMKILVLIPALVALGVLAEQVFVFYFMSPRYGYGRLLIWGAVAAGIGLVPLLTMLTRKPLGGVAFAIVIPGLVFAVSQWFYPLREGRYAWSLAWYGTLIASGAGLIALFGLFHQMEAAGEGRSGRGSPATAGADLGPAKSRSWVWLSVAKEIRLQYMTICVSAFYVVTCALIVVAQRFDSDYMGPTVSAVTALHGGFIALLVGAMSSAEERHLGTLASQILLPRAAWRQWAIKVGVSLGLAAALAAGLPALMQAIHRPPDAFRIEEEFVTGVLLATCAAMYVSSLSSNTLWALLASLPAIGLGFAMTGGLFMDVMRAVAKWIPVDYRRIGEILRSEFRTDAWQARRDQLDWIRWLERDAVQWIAIGVALLTLYFAARNHRSLERNLRTIAAQITTLLLMFWTATIACFTLARMAYNAIR